jgi:hypothetical protein
MAIKAVYNRSTFLESSNYRVLLLKAATFVVGYDLSRTNWYIGKVFENIGRLLYVKQSDKGVGNRGLFRILGVCSHLGEEMKLSQVLLTPEVVFFALTVSCSTL